MRTFHPVFTCRWNLFVSCPRFGHCPCLVLQHTSSRFYVSEEERKTSVADEIFAWDRTVSRLMDAWQREQMGVTVELHSVEELDLVLTKCGLRFLLAFWKELVVWFVWWLRYRNLEAVWLGWMRSEFKTESIIETI